MHFEFNSIGHAAIALEQHKRGRELSAMERSSFQKKQLLAERIEYDQVEMEVRE